MSRMMSNTLIPSGWSLPTLAAVADVSSGIGFPNEFQGNATGDLPFYKVSDVSFAVLKTGGILGSANHYVSYEMAERLKGRPLLVGSTVFAKIGEAVHLNRRAFVSTPCLIDNNVMAVKARFDSMDRYLHYFLKTVELGEYARSTTVPSLRKGDVESLLLPLAPEAEQTRISNQLDTLLTRVQACNDRFDAIPALLKRFRQTVLRAATSGELTVDWRRNNFGVDAASDFTEVRVGDPYSHVIRAPKLWKEASLGATCDFVGGSQPPKSTFTYENSNDLVRLIQIRDYKSDRHTTFIPKKLARRFCNKTDVMIGRYGPPIFQILRGLEGAYNVALMKAVPRTKDIDLEYLYVFLRGDQLLKFIEAGSDRTAGQDGVRKELLTPYPIFLPSLSEQAEIVRRVEAMLALVDRIEARCTTARTQAQRLTPLVLAKAFRGELVAQDPKDEPASALLARIAVVGKNKQKAPVAHKKIAQAAINL
jgi:type I restriction enzyme, S subunit